MSKKMQYYFLFFVTVFIFFRVFCGIFVIQPIGAIPNGATIIYWRYNIGLPFISSADGLLDKTESGVTLFGRAIFIGQLSKPILENKIFQFGYSETLYLWSTDGKKFDR